MANAVTLTFAGETKSVEDAFSRTGTAAKRMTDDVDNASDGFRRAGDAADEVDTKAMGFRDTLTGVQDSMAGVASLSKGPSFEGFLLLGAGVGDLGSGLYNTLIPAMKSATSWLKTTRVATLAKAAADRVAAAAQWLMNTALFASPITWIVLGILLLVGVIILIATKTDWFQKAWRAAWKWIKEAASSTWEFIKKIPGWIGTAFSKIADFISTPYKKAFNIIADAWNNTIGRLSWTVPSWIPGIGGNTISVPNLPHFHAGGRVPGAPGQEVLAVLQAGETVSSAAGGGGAMRLETRRGGTSLENLLAEYFHNAIRTGAIQLTVRGNRVAVGHG